MAERIKLLTDVAGVMSAGFMGPKVTAACRFVQNTGGHAAIGSLNDTAGVIGGVAGTQVSRV